MIFVNFKTYEEGTGVGAIDLSKILEEVAHETQIKIIPVVQAADIREIVQTVSLEVWTQHIDSVEFGAHTGDILAEAVFEDGAMGTFLNHSEHKFDEFEELKLASARATKVGLKTLIFAGDIDELKKIVELSPTFVSYEPPELVGSKTTSVAQAKPEVISKAVEIANSHNLPLIVGAGIKSEEDVRVSLRLGATGFAIASSIVAAVDPKKELMGLVEGYK
jgi:triosephosphate isomerase (TIM)